MYKSHYEIEFAVGYTLFGHGPTCIQYPTRILSIREQSFELAVGHFFGLGGNWALIYKTRVPKSESSFSVHFCLKR